MKVFAYAFAVLAFTPAIAADLLPLRHGTYSSSTCDGPPNAALLDYDGKSLKGAHTSACTVRLVRREADNYVLAEKCPAEQVGGETNAREINATEKIAILSVDSFLLSTSAKPGVSRTFHLCP